MSDIATTILEKYQIRKSRKQKDEFIEYLKTFAEENGYEMNVERKRLYGKNVVFGDVKKAKVVFTAHYDTCARLPIPNFITPLNQIFYWLYQLLICLVIFAIVFVVSFLGSYFFDGSLIGAEIGVILCYAICILMIFGPANKHTANDNTSGVVTVLEIMKKLPEEERENAAFVLFDLEETGLLGSAHFASKHKSEMNDKLLINFDCVSDGKNILFCVKKKAADAAEKLALAFPSNAVFETTVKTKGYFYPSDQANFKLGVGVAALKKSKRGILFMDKIHTKNDTVFQRENIEYLSDGAIRFIESL